MGWLKCISLLGCALVLANPSCHGAVWTAEDEARALNQGKGRISNTAPDGQLRAQEDESLLRAQEAESLEREQSLRAQFDEERARNKARGRFQQTQSRASQDFDGRRKGDAAQFSPYADRFRQYDSRTRYEGQARGSQTRQFEGRTHEGASQSDGFAETQFDGRTQFTDENEQVEDTEEPDSADRGCISCRFIRKEATKSETAEPEAGYFEDTLKSLTDAVFGGPSDGANEDGLTDTFDSERKYLEHRLQQLDNPSDSTRFGGQPQDASASPNLDGQTQYLDAKQNQGSRTEGGNAELEYLEYRRTQQLYDDSAQDVQPIQNDPTKDARFGGQHNQGGRTVDSNAELKYLEYRRTQDVQPIQNDPTQDARFGGQRNQGGRTVDNNAELEYLEYRRTQDVQPIQNDPTQDARFGGQRNQGGRTVDSNAELKYLEYLRTQDVQPIQNDPTQDARFGGQRNQGGRTTENRRAQQFQDAQPILNDPKPDARFGKPGGQQNQRAEDSNAELEYQEYRRAQQFRDAQDAQPILNDPKQDARFRKPGGQQNQRAEDSNAELEYQEYRRAQQFRYAQDVQPILNDPTQDARYNQRIKDSNAELEYQEYRRAQQFYDDSVQDFQPSLNEGSKLDNARFGSQAFDFTPFDQFSQFPVNTQFGRQTQDSGKRNFGGNNEYDPAVGNTRLGFQPQDSDIQDGFGGEFPAEDVFDGRTRQASTQLDAENFGLDSRGFGFEAPPQKTEAEIAFEAFQEASQAKLREAQEAFEAEVNRLRLLGCSSCHLVLQGAAVREGNTELLSKDTSPLKVSKLMDVDESVEAPRSTLSRDGCLTCYLINPPSPAPASIIEGAQKAGHFKVPILIYVDTAGRAAPVQNLNPSVALDLRKAASFHTSILMETQDRPFNPAARRAPAPLRRGPSGNERPFNAAPQRRQKATPVRPRERGCRSCHVVHG